MKDMEAQLKLQAYADGELSPAEAREVETWLDKDAQARTTISSLQNTTGALKEYESALRLPESREFFWSKVRREIERQETAARPAATKAGANWSAILRRFLLPAGAVAAVAIATVMSTRDAGLLASAGVTSVESAISTSGTLTYRDFSSRTTLVWLSYPAEKGLAQ